MNKVSIGVLALVVGVIIGGLLVSTMPKGGSLAGVTIEDETFKGDVAVEGTLTGSGTITATDVTASNDVTVGDNLINSAAALCIEYHATSTATTLKLTASTTNPVGGVNTNLVAAYGKCN